MISFSKCDCRGFNRTLQRQVVPLKMLPQTSNDCRRQNRCHKNPKQKPTKPLSAFDIFFREERRNILQCAIESGELTPEEAADVMITRSHDNKTNNPNLAHRPKRKKRGKIGRKEISRRISAKWSTLTRAKKQEYEASAKEDLERCRRELRMWNKSEGQKQNLGGQKHQSQQQQDLCDGAVLDSVSDTSIKSAASSSTGMVRFAQEPPAATPLSSFIQGCTNHQKEEEIPSSILTSTSSPMLVETSAEPSSGFDQLQDQRSFSMLQETPSLAFSQNGNTHLSSATLERSTSSSRSNYYDPSSSINRLASQCDGEMLDFLCSLKKP
mmetsp:Transcript_20547/g.31672  ORF Transcript_20547/g.31672 Transcript_20547/m.31672 type:complete len:325 (-) Transcript_20547:261-1235(-)